MDHKHRSQEKLLIKQASLSLLFNFKKLVNNLNLNKKVVLIVLILSPTTVENPQNENN